MNQLFLKIINMSISASWLVLAVLLLRLVLKKAPRWVNVLLWGIVAVRLICPFTIESPVSLIPDAIGSGELVSQWMDDYIDDVDIHHPDSVSYDAAISAGREPISDGEGGYYVVTGHDQLGEPATVENTVMPVLSVVWIAGIAVFALYTAISYWQLRRKLDTAILYRDNIFQNENVRSPFVLGIIRPKIYLPFKLDRQDMEHVVAHEQAHMQRKDHWWKPLGFLLLTIHWFNPLMWLAYILLCRDIELACDEKVIQRLDNEQRANYSQALVSCSVDRRMLAACPLAFSEIGVKERVRSVMNYKKPVFWITVVAIIAILAAAVCLLTNSAGDKPPAPPLMLDNGVVLLRINNNAWGASYGFVPRLEGMDDIDEAAKKNITDFFSDRGELYDADAALEKAYADYLTLEEGEKFDTYMIGQEVSLSASNDRVLYFLTTVYHPIDGSHCHEQRIGNAFDKATGELIDNSAFFSCSPDEIIEKIMDILAIADPVLRAEMKAAFSPENIIFFYDGLQICVPRGKHPSQENSYVTGATYDQLSEILYEWAIPVENR